MPPVHVMSSYSSHLPRLRGQIVQVALPHIQRENACACMKIIILPAVPISMRSSQGSELSAYRLHGRCRTSSPSLAPAFSSTSTTACGEPASCREAARSSVSRRLGNLLRRFKRCLDFVRMMGAFQSVLLVSVVSLLTASRSRERISAGPRVTLPPTVTLVKLKRTELEKGWSEA